MSQTDLFTDEPGKPPKTRKERRALDAYYTPPWMTRAFIEQAPDLLGGVLLDPCAGDGRMSRHLARAGHFSRVVLNDVAPGRAPLCYDATQPDLYEHMAAAGGPPDAVITNPPFCVAGALAWQALQHARRCVALLLRISFLEPVEARQWLLRLPPTRQIALSRDSFDGSGQTDSATCSWFIWTRGPDGLWQRGSIVVVSEREMGQGDLLDVG